MNTARIYSIPHRFLLLGLFLLVVVFVYTLLKESGLLMIVTDSDRLQNWLAGLGYWGPVGIVSLMAIAVVINPIPSAPIALASGAA
ncbi:MAG: hypothetical protein ABFS39_10900 [Pseudomonadota bacterium]